MLRDIRRIALLVFVPIITQTASCGGGAAGGGVPGGPGPLPAPVVPFIPIFENQWKGVDTNNELVEYQFTNLTIGETAGEFDEADSAELRTTSTGEFLGELGLRGSYDERNFSFETLDDTGQVVVSYTAVFVDEFTIDVTPVSPAGPTFRLFQLVEGESPIPAIDGAWSTASATFVFNRVSGFAAEDLAAFFTGYEDDANGQYRVEGYYIGGNIVFRSLRTAAGLVTTGTLADADTINSSAGQVRRGGISDGARIIVEADPIDFNGNRGLYVTDSIGAAAARINNDIEEVFGQDRWSTDPNGNFVAYAALDTDTGLTSVWVADVSDAGAPASMLVSTGFEFDFVTEVAFAPDSSAVAWTGKETAEANAHIYFVELGAQPSPPVRVVSGPGLDALAFAWSPDSGLIALLLRQVNTNLQQINTVHVDAGTSAPSNASPGRFLGLDWDPTSTYIATRRTSVNPAAYEIHRADSTGAPVVNESGVGTVAAFEWVPDLTSSAANYVYRIANAGTSDLFLSEAEGEVRADRLSQGNAGGFEVDAPGENVVYLSDGSSLLRQPLDLGPAVNLSFSAFGFFALSGDGARVAYLELTGIGVNRDLKFWSASSLQSRTILVPPEFAQEDITGFAWSADNEAIIFRREDPDSNREDRLFVIEGLAARNENEVATPSIRDSLSDDEDKSVWTPSSRRAVYVGSEPVFFGGPNLFSIGRVGAGELRLLEDLAEDGGIQNVRIIGD